jgi:tRNA (guanine-N7-)-methyltransferase
MARPLALALQAHVVDWKSSAWPLPWTSIFGREAPLALEIGFGNGEFLERQARAHPARDHVGIELSWTAATHLFRRLERAQLANVRVLLVEAEVALERFFAPESLDEVFVNHPCPWPKARHHERRLLRPEVLACLAGLMRAGAKLTVVTDHAEYAEWLGDVLRSQDALVSCHATVEVDALPGREPTKYQRKAMAQGIPIHYFEWKKAGAPPATGARPGAPPSRADTVLPPMPSLTLGGPHASARPFGDFRPRVFRELADGIEVVVKLEALFRGETGGVWLVETLVQEDKLRQEFGVLVVERPPDSLLVRLADMGRPHPTHGVRRALWLVARVLREANPALAIRHENLGAAALAEPPLDEPGGQRAS